MEWKKESAVCVVLASGGYPGSFKKGFEIKGLENIADKDTIVFHAGTVLENNKFLTSGGRVLGVTSSAGDIKSAINKASRICAVTPEKYVQQSELLSSCASAINLIASHIWDGETSSYVNEIITKELRTEN